MKKRDRLICDNMGLVYACSKKLSGRGVEYEELCSAGIMGLIKAADRFDESLGFRFSTYAVPVILGEMKQIFRDGGSVKVSRSLKELSLRVARVSEEFEHTNGREPTVGELSKILGVPAEEVAEALCVSKQPLSLSWEGDDDSREIQLPTESHEEDVTERLTLEALIDGLPQQDRELIVLRYYKERTQVETAKSLGMTQVQVSRREKKILLALREKMTV